MMPFPRPFRPAAAGLILLLAAAPALAAKLPAPQADYSARQSLTANGVTTESRLFHSRGRERREATVDGLANVLILRPDRNKAYVMQPQARIAMEISPLDPEVGLDTALLATLDGEAQGKETIGGLQATKYKVQDVFAGGGGFTGTVWATADGIYLRVDGTATDGGEGVQVHMDLTGVSRGPQDAALFDLPADVRMMTLDTLPDRPPAPGTPMAAPGDAMPAPAGRAPR
ncbi:hypothetical protein [Oleisolibacter albus]|uniref:hypothetical protein n=1 Tax=Oleisolibacter albus TaxID=2171757 RepID=UPI000DF30E0A|nr:hypothetical protein [Oleisolibacter albus]